MGAHMAHGAVQDLLCAHRCGVEVGQIGQHAHWVVGCVLYGFTGLTWGGLHEV